MSRSYTTPGGETIPVPPLRVVKDEKDPIAVACFGLEAVGHEAGWQAEGTEGATPRLFFLYSSLLTVRASEFHLPGALWSSRLPADVLAGLAASWSAPKFSVALARVMPSEFCGLALVLEAWAVMQETEEDEREAFARRLHVHPGRVESRWATAVSMDGRVATVTRFRAAVDDHAEADVPTIDGRSTPGGDIPMALCEAVAAFRAARAARAVLS